MHGGCFFVLCVSNNRVVRRKMSSIFLQEEDIEATKNLLKHCSWYYHTLKITSDCTERGFCKAPLECIRHDAVYHIMNFLTDVSFLATNVSNLFNFHSFFAKILHKTILT